MQDSKSFSRRDVQTDSFEDSLMFNQESTAEIP